MKLSEDIGINSYFQRTRPRVVITSETLRSVKLSSGCCSVEIQNDGDIDEMMKLAHIELVSLLDIVRK